MTVDFLTEIDKLVQLIESPIFTCEYILVYSVDVGFLSQNKRMLCSIIYLIMLMCLKDTSVIINLCSVYFPICLSVVGHRLLKNGN